MKLTTIYALCDPMTSEIRYIGKSISLNKRYYLHCKAIHNTYCSNWIRSLRPSKPIMVELEVVMENWVEVEQFWIAYFKSLGARLTNLTVGGEGSTGYSPTVKTRQKISQFMKGNTHARGTVPTRETRDKLSVAGKGRIVPVEVRNKLSIAGKNHPPISEETRERLSMASKGHRRNTGRIFSKESCLLISEALKGNKHGVGNKHSEETRKKISAGVKKAKYGGSK